MANMGDLAAFMNSMFTQNAPMEIANNIAIAIADAVLVDLAFSTPADTGTAVSNWQVTLDAPASDTIPAYVPSPKGRMIQGVWVHLVPPSATIQANAPAVINAGRNVLQSKQPGQEIFITNNIDYIESLDQGTSAQSPAGFVERAKIVGETVAKSQSITVFGPVLQLVGTP